MKVLFICFNIGSTVGINNGVAILSAVLKARKHQVELLFLSEDLGYDFNLDRIKQDIVKINPDVIGISLMEPQFKYAEEFCDSLRSYYKGFVICGGPYPTMDPETVISAFKQTNEIGMMSSSFNMVGLSTETKEEVFDTLRLNAAILPDSIKLMTFYPFKNTPIYNMCEKLDLIDYGKKGIQHYSKFINRSLAVLFPSRHIK